MASKQYTANQFGKSSGDPGKRQARQDRRDARQASRSGKSDDNVQVCTKESAKKGKCGAYAGGGPSTGTVQKAKNTKPSSGGEKNKVLKPGTWAYKRHQKSMDKVRKNAPAMKNLTKKQKEAQSQMGPPTPSYVTEKPKKQTGVTAAARKAQERKQNASAPLQPVKKNIFGKPKQRKTTKFTF